jgi:hypothetical protein
MCEDSDGCSNWYFKDDRGAGVWASGGNADLTITHLDATSITVHRVDSKGPVKGIVVDYTGTITNFWIEGNVAASWPGHGTGVTHMKWRGLLFPPLSVTNNGASIYHNGLTHSQAWTMCQDFGDKCSAAKPPINSVMVFSGRIGTMAIPQDYSAEIETFIDELPGGNIAIRRLDTKGTFLGATGLYIGKRTGNRIDGTLKIIWPGHSNNSMEGKWNATTAPSRCLPGMDIEIAKATANLANLSEDKASALNCYVIAANKGDSDAQDVAGDYYYVGWSGAPDYKKALEYLQKSALQGNDWALQGLAIYYKEGKAGPPNLLMANYYANRAELHKQVQGLMQTVANGSGHGKGAALDMIGNLGAYFIFGKADRNEELGATVAHEEAVIEHMNKGMSRLEAEEQVFKDDDDEKGTTVAPCEGNGGANDYRLTSQQREESYLKHSECVERERRKAEQPLDYLRCARSYKDSNAIEEHCKYFP